jgi:hypothetical protein
MIDTRAGRYEAGGVGVTHQSHAFPGNGQAAFHFRANRHKLEIAAQRITKIAVQLMTAVIADLVPQKAAADADFDGWTHELFIRL